MSDHAQAIEEALQVIGNPHAKAMSRLQRAADVLKAALLNAEPPGEPGRANARATIGKLLGARHDLRMAKVRLQAERDTARAALAQLQADWEQDRQALAKARQDALDAAAGCRFARNAFASLQIDYARLEDLLQAKDAEAVVLRGALRALREGILVHVIGDHDAQSDLYGCRSGCSGCAAWKALKQSDAVLAGGAR